MSSSRSVFPSPRPRPHCLLFFIPPTPLVNAKSWTRYGSHLHQRDARAQLFGDGGGYGGGYGYPGDGRSPPRGAGVGVGAQYRPATPNSRGQYSASVMEELESQNDAHVEGLSAKVKMLKEVCVSWFPSGRVINPQALDY